jgi:hypothetical protein
MAWSQSTSGRSAVSNSCHPFLMLAGAQLGDAAGVPPRQVQYPTYCTTPDRAILLLAEAAALSPQINFISAFVSMLAKPSKKTRICLTLS